MPLRPLLTIVFSLIWTNASLASVLALTPAQDQYLTEKGRLSYCIDPDWHPFESIQQGVHTGMSRDYINLLEGLLNTSFYLIPTQSWTQTLQYLADGKCDLIPMLNHTETRAKFARFTQAYFKDPNVIVVRLEYKNTINTYKDLTGSHTIAVIKGYMQDEFLRKHFPSIERRTVNSELEGLVKVSRGEADAIAGSLLAMTYHIQQAGLSNLHIAADLPLRDELRMAVHKDNAMLQNILDKALAQLDHQQHAEIYRAWNPISISRQTDYRLAWQVGTLFLLVLGIMLERYWSVRLLNRRLAASNQELRETQSQLQLKNEHLTHLSRYDSLTGTLNRRAMRELAEEELTRWKRQPTTLSLLIIDLDKFKQINDSYGHNKGDEVLKDFSQRVGQCLRETDHMARWGGEEFLILCRQHNENESVLYNRIISTLNMPRKSDVPTYRCSIGIAYYQCNESFEQWFERADNALYEAKQAGGNRFIVAAPNPN